MPTLAELSWPARTERLAIRLPTSADAAATWAYRRLPQVSLWMTSAATDWEDYHARWVDEERLAKTLVIEQEGRVAGDLMVSLDDAWAQAEVEDRARAVEAELGWCLDPAYARRGLATEAVRELLRLCFEDLGLRRVTASCFADNLASWRLMERIGMRRESHARLASLHRSRGWQDDLGYALLAEEWRDRPVSAPP